VQLANFTEVKHEPVESTWAELREAQLQTLKVSNTGMAVTIDIGEAKDIHPKNKQDVGLRLALIARAKVYKENIPYSGPIYKKYKVKGAKFTISFDHVGEGLQVKGDTLKGFAIAGLDKKFYWANAKIKGNKIVVWSDAVKEPMAVRYAWANNPVCNLYNTAGLPASPFRTDDWKGITE
jgi:sialate O-acetylesterase